jgi:hypothetical protein
MSLSMRLGRGTISLPRRLSLAAISLLSHVVQPESGSMTGAVMCDRSRDVPAL